MTDAAPEAARVSKPLSITAHHAIAAAWLETECKTRGIRLQREFCYAIIDRLASVAVNADTAVHEARNLMTEMQERSTAIDAMSNKLDGEHERLQNVMALVKYERAMPLWRRAFRWFTLRRCA